MARGSPAQAPHGQCGGGGGSAVPTEGLLAHYPFSGDARDHSGNGYDGTVNGPVLATDRFGTSDGAYSFDGVDDVIGLPHEPELDDGVNAAGSLGAWVYRTTTAWPLHVAGKREGCGGGINFLQLATGAPAVPSELVPLNEWIYMLVSFDGSTVDYYAG
ncbi:MAG: hypothetical protein JRD94_11330, partial [Deltaproteobacteria bacterium]|nr:hypothetical protein [Deltaproteobacteria bacterium]